MLRTLALILLVLWVLGFVTLGGVLHAFIHIVLAVAIILFVIDLLSGGRRSAV